MEQAELVCRLWPYLRQHRRVERRCIGDHLLRLDAGRLEMNEEILDIGGRHCAVDQLVADKLVAARGCRRVNCHSSASLSWYTSSTHRMPENSCTTQG